MVQFVVNFWGAHPFYMYYIINFAFFIAANIYRVKHYDKRARQYRKSIETDLVPNILAGALTILLVFATTVLAVFGFFLRLVTARVVIIERHKWTHTICAFCIYMLCACVVYYPLLLLSALVCLLSPHSVTDLDPDFPKIKK